MRRKAFTISELLITLGIIGVVAAMTIPTLSNSRPDKDRLLVLKTLDNIHNTTIELLNDSSVYETTFDDNGQETCIALGCTAAPADTNRYGNGNVPTNYNGTNKLPQLLAKNIDARYNAPVANPSDEVIPPVVNNIVTIRVSSNLTCNVSSSTSVNSPTTLSTTLVFTNSRQNGQSYNFAMDTYGNIRGTDDASTALLQNQLQLRNNNN